MAIVVSGYTGRVGMRAAVEALRAGGRALDAVVAGAREVESSLTVDSVGVGGLPNILGEVELDAGLMDGRTRAVGAVAAVRGYAHPISIAREVLQRLPHVLLAGPGAERFAAEVGAEAQALLTPQAREAWRARVAEKLGLNPESLGEQPTLAELVCRATDARRRGGTVDFLAQDASGDLAVAVSTSGYAWKYPGRVGDSPIAGAGYYADNRYGAAGCTGVGELAIRAATARTAVFHLQLGHDLEGAGRAALADLLSLGEGAWNRMSLLMLDPQGQALGFSNAPGDRIYLVMTPEMEEPEERPRVIVPASAAP